MVGRITQSGAHLYDPFHIERGPSSEQGLNRAQDILARYSGTGNNRYDTLRELFGGHEDFADAFDDWSSEEMEELLHGIIGSPEEFSRDFDEMSAEELSVNFDDPSIAELVKMYANSGREDANG